METINNCFYSNSEQIGAIIQGYDILLVLCLTTPSLTNLTTPSPPKTSDMLFIIQLLDIMPIS